MLAEKSQDNYGPLHNEKKQSKKKAKKKPSKKNRGKSIILAGTFLVGSLLVLSRYVEITDTRIAITELEKQEEELEKKKINLEAKLEGIKSSEQIAEDAMIKLGMHYPRKEQILNVSVENQNEKTDKKKESKIKSILGGIVGE